MKGKKTGLYKVAVDLHFGSTLSTLLEGLGEHQLAHPVDTIVAGLDSKMVALAILVAAEYRFSLLFLGVRNEREGKSGIVTSRLVAVAKDGPFECRAELGTGGQR